MPLKKIGILILIFPFFARSFAQLNSKEKLTLEMIIDPVLAAKFKPGGPGGVLLVSKSGRILYKKAFGVADLESGLPVSFNHIFRIASLTKQFTAVAVLQLMEQNKLELTDLVSKFIPGYPHGDSITIGNLLSHTSGIKNITEIEDVGKCITADPITPADLLNTFKNIPLDFQPGTDFHYSNSGFIVLGYIIEKISGLSYENYIGQHIFKPLGMNNAYFDHPDKIVKNRIRGYANDTDSTWKNAEYINPASAYSAGALMMTINDLYIWHRSLYSYKLIKSETLTKATTPFKLTGGQTTNYGFGMGLELLAGTPTVQHSGNINGFSSFEIYIPEDDVYVAFLSNAADKYISSTATLIASVVARKSNVNEISLKDSTLNLYVGEYQFPDSGPQYFNYQK